MASKINRASALSIRSLSCAKDLLLRTSLNCSKTLMALFMIRRVISRRFLGAAEMLELAVDGAEAPVRARVRCGALPAGARDVGLTVRKSDVLVFERTSENA